MLYLIAVSGGEDGCVYFFHVDDTTITTRRIPTSASPVLSVAVNHNGNVFASGDTRGGIMIWSRAS